MSVMGTFSPRPGVEVAGVGGVCEGRTGAASGRGAGVASGSENSLAGEFWLMSMGEIGGKTGGRTGAPGRRERAGSGEIDVGERGAESVGARDVRAEGGGARGTEAESGSAESGLCAIAAGRESSRSSSDGLGGKGDGAAIAFLLIKPAELLLKTPTTAMLRANCLNLMYVSQVNQ